MTLKEPKLGLALFLFMGLVCWLAADARTADDAAAPTGSSPTGSAPTGSSPTGGTFSSAAPAGSAPSSSPLPGSVPTDNSLVTLTDDAAIGNSAFRAVSNPVAGVNRVLDTGAPDTVNSTGDERIRSEVTETLSVDGAFASMPITAESSGGVLRLTGTVSSQEEKRRAEELAARTDGVVRVDNDIVVDTDMDGDRTGVLVST